MATQLPGRATEPVHCEAQGAVKDKGTIDGKVSNAKDVVMPGSAMTCALG